MVNQDPVDFSCSSCGQNLSASPELFGQTIACPSCNTDLLVPGQQTTSEARFQVTASPSAPQAGHQAAEQATPAIWNPNAAVNWSLFLSPAFGAFLHSRNARALGRAAEESANMRWFYGWLVFYAAFLVWLILVGPSLAGPPVAFLGLVVWYFATAKGQMNFVKTSLGKDYLRKPWGLALVRGIGCVVVFIAASAALPALSKGMMGGERKDALVAAQQVLRNSSFGMAMEVAGTEILSSEIIAEKPPYYQVLLEIGQPGDDPAKNGAMCVTLKMSGGGEYLYYGPEMSANIQTIHDRQPVFQGILVAQRVNAGWPGAEEEMREIVIQLAKSLNQPAGTNTPAHPNSPDTTAIHVDDEPEVRTADPEDGVAKRDRETKAVRESMRQEAADKMREATRKQAMLEAQRAEELREQARLLEQTRREEAEAERRSDKRADFQGQLAAVDSKIASEKKRWVDATAVINNLTNFKKKPVQEGTQAYYRCVEASKVIQDVEQGASDLKAEKARLEETIKSLE